MPAGSSRWNHLEETASCGQVSNRTFGFGTPGTCTVNDTVAAWAGVGGC